MVDAFPGLQALPSLPVAGIPVELHWLACPSVHCPSAFDALTEAEQRHSEGLARPDIRRRYIFFRAALRHILAARTGSTPQQLEFAYGEHGKPALSSPEAPAFNLSHSGDCGLIALGPVRSIGVDLEDLRRRSPVLELARRFWSEAEVAELHSLPPEEQRSAFFRGWVRKEAWIKALGSGMQTPLDRFSVSLSATDDSAWMRDAGDRSDLRFTHFLTPTLPSPHHGAALVVVLR